MSELVKGKYFRVTNIDKVVGVDSVTHELKLKTLAIKEGLAIEKKDSDGKSYYVIAFVKPIVEKPNPLDSKNIVFISTLDDVKLEDVDFRTVDLIKENSSPETLWEIMQEYKTCVDFAKKAVQDAAFEE